MNVTPVAIVTFGGGLWPAMAPVRQNGVLPVLLAFP
jgi:hypothetical protein